MAGSQASLCDECARQDLKDTDELPAFSDQVSHDVSPVPDSIYHYERYRKIHAVLHKLWTKAVSQPGYVKSDWMALDGNITELAHQGLGLRDRVIPSDRKPEAQEDPTQVVEVKS